MAWQLKLVVFILGSERAFAALKSDGTVVTWGEKGCSFVASYLHGGLLLFNLKIVIASGGDSSMVRSELKQVVALSSTGSAFAARRSDGTVVTWGNNGEPVYLTALIAMLDCGGDSTSVPRLKKVGAVECKGSAREPPEKVQQEKERKAREEQAARVEEARLKQEASKMEQEKLQKEREAQKAKEQEAQKAKEREAQKAKGEEEVQKAQREAQEKANEQQQSQPQAREEPEQSPAGLASEYMCCWKSAP